MDRDTGDDVMTGPAYYRPRVPAWLWLTLVVTVGLVVLLLVARSTVTMIRETERTRVYSEAQQYATAMFTLQRASWQRQLDSLREVLVVRDSAAGASAYEARGAITALRHQLALKPTTQRETLFVAVVAAAVNACTVALNDCELFRASAAVALAKADSLRSADSTAFRGLSFRMTASNDSLRTVSRALDRAPTWGTVVKTNIVSAASGALLCLVFCK